MAFPVRNFIRLKDLSVINNYIFKLSTKIGRISIQFTLIL